MNIFAFCGFIGGVAGAFAGGVFGLTHYGWPGMAVGIPAGAIGGFVTIAGGIAGCFAVAIAKERFEQRLHLRKHFGRYWISSHLSEWQALDDLIRPGQEVSGEVVAYFYYGVFVDIGLGFPALLKHINSRSVTELSQSIVGTPIRARYRGKMIGIDS